MRLIVAFIPNQEVIFIMNVALVTGVNPLVPDAH